MSLSLQALEFVNCQLLTRGRGTILVQQQTCCCSLGFIARSCIIRSACWKQSRCQKLIDSRHIWDSVKEAWLPSHSRYMLLTDWLTDWPYWWTQTISDSVSALNIQWFNVLLLLVLLSLRTDQCFFCMTWLWLWLWSWPVLCDCDDDCEYDSAHRKTEIEMM